MTFCWFAIKNFPSEIFKPDVIPEQIYDKKAVVKLLNCDIFSDELVSWFNSRELKIHTAITFFRESSANFAEPHIDLTNDGNFASPGINVELMGRGVMGFYQPEDRCSSKVQYTRANTPFLKFTYNEICLVDETDFISGPRLVRTDIPHDVRIIQGPRLALSIRVRESGEPINWTRIVEKLSGDIIERIL